MKRFILVNGKPEEAPDMGKSFWQAMQHGQGSKINLLECIFARIEEYWEVTMARDWAMTQAFLPRTMVYFELARPDKFVEQLKACDVVYFQAGNVEKLADTLKTIPHWHEELAKKTVICTVAGLEILDPLFAEIGHDVPLVSLRPGEFTVFDYDQ